MMLVPGPGSAGANRIWSWMYYFSTFHHF